MPYSHKLAPPSFWRRLSVIPILLGLLFHWAIAAGELVLPDSVRHMPQAKQLNWLIFQGEHFENTDPIEAVGYYKLAEELASELEDNKLLLHSRSRLARLFAIEGFYAEALELCYSGKELARETKDTSLLINFMYWESGALNQMGEFDRSIEIAKQCIDLDPDSTELARGWALNALAEAYRYKGDYHEAEGLYLNAYAIFTAPGFEAPPQQMKPALVLANNLAHNYFGKGAADTAQSYLDILYADPIFTQRVDLNLEANLCQVRIWEQAGDFERANSLAHQMMDLARSQNYPSYELQFAEWLFESAEKRGDYQAALEHLQHQEHLKEAERKEKARIRMSLQESELENLNLRNRNELLEVQQENQRLLNFLLAGLLILGVVFFALQIRTNRKMRRINALLLDRNEELDEANREISGLIGVVAHDLKAPLNKSILLAEVMTDQTEVSDFQKDLLDKISRTCTDGGILIQDLLEISSLDSEKVELKILPTDLEQLVGNIVAGFQPEAQKKDIQLHFEKESLSGPVPTDPARLQRVLDNLISNAIKFTPRKGQVWVKLHQGKGEAGISIKDEGPGFSQADQKKMFGKFQRLSARPTGGESSNGLGLSIVKSLVDRLGIKLEFESSPGNGTEFRLWIPEQA